MSILKPTDSVMASLSTAALVGFIYAYGLPNLATIGATAPNDINIESGRRKAAWTAAAAVGLITLMTRDKTIFVVGGATVVALDMMARHANATPPTSAKVISNADYQSAVSIAPEPSDGAAYDMNDMGVA